MRGKSVQVHVNIPPPIAASMRPAHYAREVTSPPAKGRRSARSFNEARALCAGSLFQTQQLGHWQVASMRPAHYAREVTTAYSTR